MVDRVMILGPCGSREDAIADWVTKKSPQQTDPTELFIIGGNAGTRRFGTNLNVNPEDLDAVIHAAKLHQIDLLIPGPEIRLVEGAVNQLTAAGIPTFGPTKEAVVLESRKDFSSELLREIGAPYPRFEVFDDPVKAKAFVYRNQQNLWVVKVAGLGAHGRGVTLCYSPQETDATIERYMVEREFGESGATILLQEMLRGTEVSAFYLVDKEGNVVFAGAACDYKPRFDGDTGPNTGGIGAFSWPSFWSAELEAEIRHTYVQPVVDKMAARGTPFVGVLYLGLMITTDGRIMLLEFNCRWGDPETQVILPLIMGNPIEIMMACIEGRLPQISIQLRYDRHYVGVVMVSGGYPEESESGFEITGLDSVEDQNTRIAYGNIRLNREGTPETSGGRVCTLIGGGRTIRVAQRRAYVGVYNVRFYGAGWRSDIAAPGTRELAGGWHRWHNR